MFSSLKLNKITIKMIFFIIFICILNLSNSESSYKNTKIIELDQYNFDETISQNEFVFVLIYKKNSKRSEEILIEFEKASKNQSNRNIQFGLIDKDESGSEHILKNLGFSSYPRIALIYLGYQINYENGYLEENFNIFLSIKQKYDVKDLKDFAEIKDYRKMKETVIFVGDTHNKNEGKYVTFLKATKTFDDVLFAKCSSQNCMENFDNFSGMISIYNGFSNEIFNLDNFSDKQLISFINEHTTKIFPSLDDGVSRIIFNGYSSGLFLFLDGTSENHLKNTMYFFRAGRYLKKVLHLVVAEFHSDLGQQVAEVLKMKDSDLPKIYIIDCRKEEIQLYKMGEEINEENIFEFAKNWGLDKLKPIVFSEPTPNQQSYPIMTLVGDNYKEIVLDSQNDVIVYYFSPKCEPCKKFERIFRKVVNAIIKEYGDILQFGRINGEMNDITGVSVLAYPAVNFYLRNYKNKPLKYEIDDFNADKFVEFISKNSKGKILKDTIMNRISLINENDALVNTNLEDSTGKIDVNYVKDEI